MASKLNLQAVYFPKRLVCGLENIKKYPLTILEAPSGFGKTTALNGFFSRSGFEDTYILSHTFFSDNAEEYWQWLCEALESVDKISAEALKGFGFPCSENLCDICEILKELECFEEVYIVLDNLSGSAKGLGEIFTALSCRTEGKLHFVASVQAVGAKNSFSLLSGKSAYVIGAADFVFSKDDCRAYFAGAGIVLTETELSELLEITDGWIFAVYLQLLFYSKNRKFEKGIHGALIEKAFFARLGADERLFYITLSPFKSFTLRQAAAVSGKSVNFARASLSGGFVHYDANKQEYYFHNLLREHLCEAFEQLETGKKNEILIKAAEWEEQNGENINAIGFYYRAGEFERIFSMSHNSYDLADIGNADTRKMVFDILDKTPQEVKLSHVESMIPLAFILFFLGENEKLGETCGEIYSLVEKSSLTPEKKNAVLGETELLVSFTKYNDIAEMSRHHRKAYELLGKKAGLINMRSTWSFGSPSVMCLYHSEAGALSKELELMDKCMPYYYRLTGGHGCGAEFAMRAEAEFMCGSLAAAETAAHRAIFEAQSKNQSSIYQCGLFILANIALQQGDETKLFDVLYSMSESAAANTEDMCRYTLSLFTGFIYAFTNRTAKIENVLQSGNISANAIAPMTMPFAYMIYGKALLNRGEYLKLLAFCPFACKAAEAANSVLPKIYFDIYLCCANLALGKAAEATAALESAFSLALPDRLYMPFAQNYRNLKPILKNVKPGRDIAEINRLGAEFEKAAAQIGPGSPKLSPREREVAELIRQGLTNKQIASRLYVSISTVKLTISNIFDKTGIKSRTQLYDAKI